MVHFGPLNRLVSIANHTVVLLDAPGLVEEDIQRLDHGQPFSRWKPVRGGPVEFVNAVAEGKVYLYPPSSANPFIHSSNHGAHYTTKPYSSCKRESRVRTFA
jgi:hypothetical protein